MRSIAALLLLLTAISLPAKEECDCTSYPFRPNPPCYSVCVARLSSHKNVDLSAVKNIDPEVMRGITILSESNRRDAINFNSINGKADLEREVLKSQLFPLVASRGSVGHEIITSTATVQAVDQEKRIVTLKGPEGNVFDIKVGPEVRNLAQVKPGDIVVAKYFEAVAVEVKKGGLGIRGKESATAVSRVPLGEGPAGAVATTTTIVANVVKVDARRQVVTLEGPSGRNKEVKVKDPQVFSQIKVGEQVEMVVTEALGLALQAPKK